MSTVVTSDRPLPDRGQARRLVSSLAIFWGLWGVAIGIFFDATPPNPLGALFLLAAMASCWYFYYTLYSVWSPAADMSPLRMLLLPSLRGGLTATRAMLNLFRPSWVRATVNATGWPKRLVGYGLASLLLIDLALMARVVSHTSHPLR
jgi:hypothetical protein